MTISQYHYVYSLILGMVNSMIIISSSSIHWYYR